MGTRWLVDSSLYQDALAKFNIEAIRPSAHDRDRLNKIIMDELVLGVIDPSSVKRLTRIIQHFVEASCDAVILGCTELPLCLTDANSALPTLDSTRILARAALEALKAGVGIDTFGGLSGVDAAYDVIS